MKKLTLIFMINFFLMVMTGISSEAKISVGLSTSALSKKTTQATITRLEKELSATAGVAIEIRQFNDEKAINNWLLRFQQIDAAIVTADFIRQQPAGSLSHLIDFHFAESSKGPLALAARLNLDKGLQKRIREAFLSISKSDSGFKSLAELGFAGTTEPGAKLVRKETQPKIVKAVPKKTVETAPEITIKTTVQPEPKQQLATKPVRTEDKPEPQAPVTVKTETEKEPKIRITEKPKADETKNAKQKVAEVSESENKAAETLNNKTSSVYTKEKQSAANDEQDTTTEKQDLIEKPIVKTVKKQAYNKRIKLFIVLIIIAAFILKVVLITLKWQNKQRTAQKYQSTPAIDAPVKAEVKETAKPDEEPDVSETVIEEGTLGPGKVPELLKRCADLPKPVILKINKGSSEKLIYFAGGQVSAAYTYNTNAESGGRWNKLGSLLVRENLITDEERDQGMALVLKEPELRLGEALLKLGLIDLQGLRHALTRQAKLSIFSLILFPEGNYQILDEASSLPAEESISLEVISLIREASHHQSEWRAIRQTLPNLNKKLQFSAVGQEKLEKVNLAPQQQTTLALIDGKRTINDLCAESSMLDYEVYRFLYLMVKTGVLE